LFFLGVKIRGNPHFCQPRSQVLKLTGAEPGIDGGPVQTRRFCAILALLSGLALPLAAMNNKGRMSGESGLADRFRLAKGFLSTALKAVRSF
jgi:hypothetical protein